MTHRQHWLVVPAAGIGQRMSADRPKQYLQIHSRYILDITLSRLLDTGWFSGAMVSLHPDDIWFTDTDSASDLRVLTCVGGADRADSVLAGLVALKERVSDDDWILVHDVARPCFALEDIRNLMLIVEQDPVGGLLAAPVTDTIKRQQADTSRVAETVSRDGLWRAMTPQQFRYGLLKQALAESLAGDMAITDESSAIEAAGHAPQLVAGRADNIKITVREDLALAGWLLQNLQ